MCPVRQNYYNKIMVLRIVFTEVYFSSQERSLREVTRVARSLSFSRSEAMHRAMKMFINHYRNSGELPLP